MVAALNKRLMAHCACQCDDDGNIDPNEVCLAHRELVDEALQFQREQICNLEDEARRLQAVVTIQEQTIQQLLKSQCDLLVAAEKGEREARCAMAGHDWEMANPHEERCLRCGHRR